jgi:protein-disulfide isomerase
MITYKQFPLTQIHKNAYRDAIAGLCAAEQGKYMEYKKTLYALEAEKAGATVTDADRVEIARANGLDAAAMTQCLADNRYSRQVDAEMAEGDAKGVSGTPTTYLDGSRLDVGAIFADMEKGKAFMDRILAQ